MCREDGLIPFTSASTVAALQASQWQQLYDYQTKFGVRMVRIDARPSDDYGVFSSSNARRLDIC